ncbi:hypothetical protein POTOM_023996 [Populus tomentosa]|uniref:DUF3511 domain protein n=2 Tax=Populus TaxID=3689 RepID=A0A8X8CZX1_POPTO|nr:hypothetical protein POTOM_023996 [Populus tomentosa]
MSSKSIQAKKKVEKGTRASHPVLDWTPPFHYSYSFLLCQNQEAQPIKTTSPTFIQCLFLSVSAAYLYHIPNPMEDYNRSRSYSYSHGNDMMQMESYHGPQRPPTSSYELRSYSTSYAQTQVANGSYNTNNFGNNRDFKVKKGKGYTGSSSSKSWSFDDPEFQRKKRVASYKMYSVEGKVKGTFRKSFRWIKDRLLSISLISLLRNLIISHNLVSTQSDTGQ